MEDMEAMIQEIMVNIKRSSRDQLMELIQFLMEDEETEELAAKIHAYMLWEHGDTVKH